MRGWHRVCTLRAKRVPMMVIRQQHLGMHVPLTLINNTRQCSTNTPGSAVLTPSADLVKMYDTRPISERLAAAYLASHLQETKSPQTRAAMPLKNFVVGMPNATRDAILKSGLDVPTWIRSTQLLRLAFMREDGSWSHDDGEVAHDEDGQTEPPTPTYGSMMFVELSAGDVEAYRHLTGADADAAEHQPIPRPSSDVWCEANVDRLLRSVMAKKLEQTGYRYCAVNDAYSAVLRAGSRQSSSTLASKTSHTTAEESTTPFSFDEFRHLVMQRRRHRNSSMGDGDALQLWLTEDERFLTVAAAHEGEPPRFTNPLQFVRTATAENNYGGWGSVSAVPTKQDVYEILKYIPLNWGNMGNLGIPSEVKKRHMRTSSPLQWFRRQPHFFELRNMGGTVEIRRSILLHPEHHQLTKDEAWEQLHQRMASGEANDLTALGADGKPLDASMSAVEKIIHKFFTRVCPGYFVPLSLILQRYTKKNLTTHMLLAMAQELPQEFEVLQSKLCDLPLVRRRIGADSSRWRQGWLEDFERHPEDVRALLIIFNRLCPTWDRPEFVYIRLTPQEQSAVGGFEAMMEVMRRHPAQFRLGERLVCRVDPSDPTAQEVPEPADDDNSRIIIRPENPYQSPLEVVKVLHYIAPAEACSISVLVEHVSPAIRAVLPPRVVPLLILFPQYFTCRETAPGVHSIQKIVKTGSRPRPRPTSAADSAATTSQTAGVADDEEALRMELEAEEEILTKAAVVAAVRELVPEGGVELANLLLWASLAVQRAATRHYGGLTRLLEVERGTFRLVESEESRRVFRAA